MLVCVELSLHFPWVCVSTAWRALQSGSSPDTSPGARGVRPPQDSQCLLLHRGTKYRHLINRFPHCGHLYCFHFYCHEEHCDKCPGLSTFSV